MLAAADNIKLRLGSVNGVGEQKGVDARIITDMASLSRVKAISDAVLLTGDEDLRIGIELAQEHGVRVHLLIIQGTSVATSLRYEADTVTEVSAEEIRPLLRIATPPHAPEADPLQVSQPVPAALTADMPCRPEPTDTLSETVDIYLHGLNETARQSLAEAITVSGSRIPAEHDGRVLASARSALGRDLDSQERTLLRDALRDAVLGATNSGV